jgi:hypothetical protein
VAPVTTTLSKALSKLCTLISLVIQPTHQFISLSLSETEMRDILEIEMEGRRHHLFIAETTEILKI